MKFTESHWEEGHVKTEVGITFILPQTKESQELPASARN